MPGTYTVSFDTGNPITIPESTYKSFEAVTAIPGGFRPDALNTWVQANAPAGATSLRITRDADGQLMHDTT